MSELEDLADLLRRTAEAHHQAFIATDGFDPNWPNWYATYLLENGFDQFVKGATVSAVDLARLLTEADRQNRTKAAPPPWERFYAKLLLAAFNSDAGLM